MTRPKMDVNVPPAITDYLFEVEQDCPPDPLEKFVNDASCAGSYKMASDVAWRHLEQFDAEAREAKERNEKFAKRFGARATAERGDKLEKAARVPARVETKNGWRLEYDRNNELLRAFEVSE